MRRDSLRNLARCSYTYGPEAANKSWNGAVSGEDMRDPDLPHPLA